MGGLETRLLGKLDTGLFIPLVCASVGIVYCIQYVCDHRWVHRTLLYLTGYSVFSMYVIIVGYIGHYFALQDIVYSVCM